jgi:hypothetical protein
MSELPDDWQHHPDCPMAEVGEHECGFSWLLCECEELGHVVPECAP